jgi:tRNA(Ile2) C34 agmatinyltransferase TiaS
MTDIEQLVYELSTGVGALCPDCGSQHTEDNGSGEYRCVDCDHRWGIDNGERYGY